MDLGCDCWAWGEGRRNSNNKLVKHQLHFEKSNICARHKHSPGNAMERGVGAAAFHGSESADLRSALSDLGCHGRERCGGSSAASIKP